MLDTIILGMLCHSEMTGYDLKKRIESGVGIFYKASCGSIYPALARLSAQGLVTAAQKWQGSRAKKIYTVTPQGKQVFLRWLNEPLGNEKGGSRGRLVKVYFFDALPAETAKLRLLEYEEYGARYLRRLEAMARSFDTAEFGRDRYYELSTLYYGIGVLRETLHWCRFIREKKPFRDFLGEELANEPDKE